MTCSFQGTAFLLRIDPLKRLNCSLVQVQEIWIVAEALERFVERHGACAEVAERAPATAVRGVEQHDLVAVAGQAQPRQRFPGAAREQAVAVGAEAHQHAPAAGERTAADALEDGGIGRHDEPSPCGALRLNGLHRKGINRCPVPLSRPSWPASSRASPPPCRRGHAPPSLTCCWVRPPPKAATSPTPSWLAASRAAGARTTGSSSRGVGPGCGSGPPCSRF